MSGRIIMDIPGGSETPGPYAPKGKGARIRYFLVRGKGPFPHDMLRYDRAWALTGVDSLDHESWRQPWRSVVCATRETRVCPSTERWESFGWECEVLDKAPEWLDQAKELT